MLQRKLRSTIALLIIIILAFLLRISGINWDQSMHLHPDERMLIMVADRINFFTQLDPDFFNYGTLPIYLLRGVAQLTNTLFKTHITTYDGMLYVGRLLSTFADLGVIFLIYQISQKLFQDKKISFFAAFFYASAFFPIQNSHFFIVDTFLNLFLLGVFYSSLAYFEKPDYKHLMWISVCFAAAITTKITAIIFVPFLVGVIVLKNIKKPLPYQGIHYLIFIFSLFTFSFLFMPYAYLHHQKFLSDVLAQIRLNSDPYVFPYTLQYVDTTPYIYYLKNIFLWGLGPFISFLSVCGLIILAKQHIVRARSGTVWHLAKSRTSPRALLDRSLPLVLFFTFYFLYFLIIGRSAVKFMRYMLPMYPFFTMLAGYASVKIYKSKAKPLLYPTLVFALAWTLLFNSMYFKEHTRITATKWIEKHIPEGATLAVEHWDDRLPLYGGEKYTTQELQLYNQPDDMSKWQTVNGMLNNSDYMIIASNRLYIPLQKLSDCSKYKSCYPKTAAYYQNLFAGLSPYVQVAEFKITPGFQIGGFNFRLTDQSADESFTVYDHPKIMIFKNMGARLL